MAPAQGKVASTLSSVLDRVPQASRQAVEHAATHERLAAGEQAIAEGAALDSLLIVDAGLLRVTTADGLGHTTEIARYGPGDFCGEMAFLSGERASATVSAVIDSTVWRIPFDALAGPAQASPELASYLANGLAKRLSAANARFHARRLGRAVAVLASPGARWAQDLLVCVGESAARQAARPVLLMDLEAEAPPTASRRGPALSGDPSSLADALSWHDEAVKEGDAHLIVIGRGDTRSDSSAVAGLIEELQRRYALVLVRLAADTPPGDPLLRVLDGPLNLALEDEDARRDIDPGAETIVLRASPQPSSPGELRALSRARGVRVIRVLPGGAQGLSTYEPAGSGEPWDTVAWTARHLLRRKVGLALGAGGSKGYAHIGVIAQLQEWGVPIDAVAGCSIGAPIAAAFADGWDVNDIKERIDAVSRRALRPAIPVSSILRGGPLRSEIARIAGGKQFEELRTPLALVAVDMQRREEVVMTEGDVGEAIVASFSIPAIYPPAERNGRLLVDGALLNPVPVSAVSDLGADIVIGVQLTNPIDQQRPAKKRRGLFRSPPIVDTISQAFEVMQWQLATRTAAQADITIEPAFTGSTSLRDFHRGTEFVEVGRQAAAGARHDLERWLPWLEQGA